MHTEIRLLLLCAAAWVIWSWSNKARETVDRISKKICQDMQLQRLDDGVALQRLRFSHGEHGFGIQRIYRFEYSTHGGDRRHGEIGVHNATPIWASVELADGPVHIALR